MQIYSDGQTMPDSWLSIAVFGDEAATDPVVMLEGFLT